MLLGETVSERQTIIEEVQDASLNYLAQLKNAGGQAFGSLGLTYGQAMLLLFVERGHTTPNELSKLLGVVPTALSALVTKLVNTGLFERQTPNADGRRVTVYLTSEGMDACQALKRAWREHFPLDLNGFGDEELKILVEAARIASRRGLI